MAGPTLQKLDDGSLIAGLIEALEDGNDEERECAALARSLQGDSRASEPPVQA